MILDNYLSYQYKVIISVICAGLWIYFRTSECYSMIPRQHLLPILFVMSWTYLNYYEPLFLPIGLLILIIYSTIRNNKYYTKIK
jgi:hypothetical protein